MRQNGEHSAGWPWVADGSASPWAQRGRGWHGEEAGPRRHCRQGWGGGLGPRLGGGPGLAQGPVGKEELVEAWKQLLGASRVRL